MGSRGAKGKSKATTDRHVRTGASIPARRSSKAAAAAIAKPRSTKSVGRIAPATKPTATKPSQAVAGPAAAPQGGPRAPAAPRGKAAARGAGGPGRPPRDSAARWPLADAALNAQLRAFAAGLIGPEALRRALADALAAGALAAGASAFAAAGARDGGDGPGDSTLLQTLIHFADGRIAPICMHRILNEAFGRAPARAGPYLGPSGGWRRTTELAAANSVWIPRPDRRSAGPGRPGLTRP